MTPNPAEEPLDLPPDVAGNPRPPAADPWRPVRRVLKPLASLQLTVVLFALSLGLVFFGTMAQKVAGLGAVVDNYFWSWVVWVPFELFSEFGKTFFELPADTRWKGAFPFPAGKLLGGAMLVNLLAAHVLRFRVTWKRSGILLIHSGLVLLFVGEFITREHSVEQRMIIPEGASVGYTQDAHLCELAFTDLSGPPDPAGDAVAVIPENLLRQTDTRIAHGDLPVDVVVTEFHPNADVGEGPGGLVIEGKPEVTGADPDQKVDLRGARVDLYRQGTDERVASLPVHVSLKPRAVKVGEKTYAVALRFKRYYKPYTVHLLEFRFDRFVGTNTARNFSSRVVVRDPERDVEREVTISMNNPLRYRGETLYQGGYDPTTEKTTILQVVRNPGWFIPYVSCVVVTVGLLVHFGIYLTQFLVRRAAA